ncbi:MAG: hypothetical protein JW836_16820 [Deltaproteobacteria bacterium]|nr:hypothetical protein [Deltaproteobacteria bacterium]
MKRKEDRMSGRERMEALLNYQKPDRVPINMITVGFPCVDMGKPVASCYQDPETYFEAFFCAAEKYGWDLVPQNCPHVVLGSQDFGGTIRLPKSEFEGALVVTSFPVKTEQDIEGLSLPDPKGIDRIVKALKFSQLQVQEGLPVTFVSRSPFSVASNICGLEKFSRWLIKKPELCERLMELAIDHIFNVLEWWGETFGSERIFAFLTSPCESNQVISPKQFERFALPYHLVPCLKSPASDFGKVTL